MCKAVLINRREGEKVAKLMQLLANKMGDQMTLSSGEPNSIEVMAAGVSKEAGLRNLSSYLNIPLSNVMAFGDQKKRCRYVEDCRSECGSW